MKGIHRNKKGFSLIEVMVAMLVITVGLLGLSAMQATALKGSSLGGNMSSANNIARDVAERIFKNASNAGAYDRMDTLGGLSPNCPQMSPIPACQRDFIDWQASVGNFSEGRLQITSTVNLNFDLVLVTISWSDLMGEHAVRLPLQVAP